MDSLLEKLTEWLKEMLITGITDQYSGIFDAVNQQVGNVAAQVGTTPSAFSPDIFSMIRNISESVILPIAGIVLTFIACMELIQMIVEKNNLSDFDTWMFFKWVFKTLVAVMLVSHTFDITMAVFDIAQNVINNSSGLITSDTAISASAIDGIEASLQDMEVFPLLGVYLQSFLLNVGMKIMSILIFVIVYGRMIEIYLMTSLAPIPFATFGNREQSQIGQNFLRSLAALGFQGFLIMICVGIYAVLIQGISFSSDITASVWGVLGYTVLLCFTLFKTGDLAKSVFNAH
ncbi:MAG: CD0415/CD1112 family protein [Bulleidia sp.]|nr:CD0415/CD1112 family protein [Bulleidia sp.]